MIRVAFIFWSLSFILFSCREKATVETRYYNIDSLIKTQINLLAKHDIVLTKEVLLDGKIDTIITTIRDSTVWLNELDAFRQLKIINNAHLALAYNVEIVPDTRSNLTVRKYSTSQQVPVEYLNLYFYNATKNLRKIEALYRVENSMFISSRLLTMEFENIYNKITLTNYTIEGKQKMIMGDTLSFHIKGTLKIN